MIVPVCLMGFLALSRALRQQQKPILSWLFPLVISHVLVALFYLYGLCFYVFHWKLSLTYTFVAYGFVSVGLFIALYTAWRILIYVTACCSVNVSHQEGIWPPPPAQRL